MVSAAIKIIAVKLIHFLIPGFDPNASIFFLFQCSDSGYSRFLGRGSVTTIKIYLNIHTFCKSLTVKSVLLLTLAHSRVVYLGLLNFGPLVKYAGVWRHLHIAYKIFTIEKNDRRESWNFPKISKRISLDFGRTRPQRFIKLQFHGIVSHWLFFKLLNIWFIKKLWFDIYL